MTEETIIIPSYEEIIQNGRWDFLQKIEKQETIDEKTGEKTIDYIENLNTGGHFWICNKNDNSNLLGWLCLYQGKLYIVDEDTQNITITQLNTNTFEDLENLKNTYDIYYEDIDKEKSDELQPVYIEDENNIQTDKGIFLFFNNVDLTNPNSELYLSIIYNGEFKEVTEETINPETNEKTTEIKKSFTGDCNVFNCKGKIIYSGELKYYKADGLGVIYHCNGNKKFVGRFDEDEFVEGESYREDGTLLGKGTFTKNKDGHIVLHGNNCAEYYEDGKTIKYKGIFKEGHYIVNKNEKISINETYPDISIKIIETLLPSGIEFKEFSGPINSNHISSLNGQPSVIMIRDKNGTQHTVFYDGKKIHDSWYNCFFDLSPLQDCTQYYSNDIVNNRNDFFFEKASQQKSNEGYCVFFFLANAHLYNKNKLNNSNKILQNIKMKQELEKIIEIKDGIDFHINGEEIKRILV